MRSKVPLILTAAICSAAAAAAAAAVDGCSGLLVRHARRVLGAAADVLNKPGRPRMLKAVREVRSQCVICACLAICGASLHAAAKVYSM
jgi:hypothetical protein